ncbi:hypothetical protein ACFCY9_19305 [Streptomyces fimicarius]|uniref:hypothetical protein n=1 Tax=Streptomyces griseus TaxID=1911 RepID=UPI0035E16496
MSGTVAPALAAQVIGTDRPEQILPLLQQIEASGLQALGSMDRTVHMLRSSGGTDPGGRDSTAAEGVRPGGHRGRRGPVPSTRNRCSPCP